MKNIFSLITILFIGTQVFSQEDPDMRRLYEVYTYVDRMYVDEVPSKEISEAAIVSMLEKLDPHSTYIPAEEVEQANERINGSFVGVGIRFNILRDTLLVVNPIPGGPSEKIGIQAGDKIIKIDEINDFPEKITHTWNKYMMKN
jgi:carboxyl-terminal processing protease